MNFFHRNYARQARCAVLTPVRTSNDAALALFPGTAGALSAALRAATAGVPRLAFLTFALTGCTIGDGRYPRPRDLTPTTLVDRLRILAIVAEPPEVAPGTPVTFSALVADPDNDLPFKAWLACPPDQPDGCTAGLAEISPDASPEELAALGVIGLEPGFPPAYTPDAALLDGLDENARREGVYVSIQLAAFPASVLAEDPEDLDFNAVEVAFKRLVVSEASTPNHNPTLGAFTVDGVEVPVDATLELDVGEPYEIGVVIPDEAIETYEYLTSEGAIEERTEEPYVDWYCTVGGLGEAYTLHPFTQADFAPEEPGDATCWAVARDRRGGMAFQEQHFTIR